MKWEIVEDAPVQVSVIKRLFVLLNRAQANRTDPIEFVLGPDAWNEVMSEDHRRLSISTVYSDGGGDGSVGVSYNIFGIPLRRAMGVRGNYVAINASYADPSIILTYTEPKE